MDNKLFKILVKMQTQLLIITSNLLNINNELLEKVHVENENGEFVEDKNHWNKMLLEIDKLANLIYKFEDRALAITDKSEIQILNRFLIDDFQKDYEILCDIEEKHLGSDDPRTKCLKKAVFFQTYIWEIIDRTEKQFGISSEPADKPSKQLKTKLKDQQISLLYNLLVKDGFICDENKESFQWIFGGKDKPDFFIPIKWIKTNSLTNNKALNKLALLNLLWILKVPESQIIDKLLLNNIFAKPDGKSIKYTSSNYPSKGYSSEYNKQLIEIVGMLG